MELHYLQLLGVTVLLAIVAVFIAKQRYRQLHDRIFIAFECCRALCLLIAMRFVMGGTEGYNYFVYLAVVIPASLCMLPLAFLYVRTVAKDHQWHRWYWWVFSPAIFIGMANIILSLMVGWDNIISKRHGNFTTFVPDPDNLVENLYRWICVDAPTYINLAMSMVFLILCIYYLISYNKKAKDYFANIEDSCFGSIGYFFGTTIFLHLTMTLGFLLVVFVPQIFRDEAVIGLNLWIAALSIVAAYFAYQIRMTEEQVEAMDVEIVEDNANSILAQKIAAWEDREDKPYCKKGLTVRKVAEDLNVSYRALSPHIKEHKGMGFNKWVNTLRIEEAKRRLSISSDVKITTLALELGFNDHSAFIKVFRQQTGMTPQSYRNSIGSEISVDGVPPRST